MFNPDFESSETTPECSHIHVYSPTKKSFSDCEWIDASWAPSYWHAEFASEKLWKPTTFCKLVRTLSSFVHFLPCNNSLFLRTMYILMDTVRVLSHSLHQTNMVLNSLCGGHVGATGVKEGSEEQMNGYALEQLAVSHCELPTKNCMQAVAPRALGCPDL